MTVIAAIKYDNGFVLGSDSQISNKKDSYMEHGVEKISIHKSQNFAVGVCGEKRFCDAVKENIQETTFTNKRPVIRDEVERIVNEQASSLRSKFGNLGREMRFEGGSVILTGIDNQSRSYCYGLRDEGGYVRVNDFEVRGSGETYAKTLIRNRTNQLNLNQEDALQLAYNTIKRTIELDRDVGGQVTLMVADEVTGLDLLGNRRKDRLKKAFKLDRNNIQDLEKYKSEAVSQLFSKVEEHGLEEIEEAIETLEPTE